MRNPIAQALVESRRRTSRLENKKNEPSVEEWMQDEMNFGDEESWKAWKAEVNSICRQAFMMDSDCMADFLWRDAHDAGNSAWEAVNDAVDQAWGDDMPGIEDAWNAYIVKGIPH